MLNIDYNLKDPINKSFAELLKFKMVDNTSSKFSDPIFQSLSKAFQPVAGASAVFGGHVLGQSAWVAAQTVPEGYICHSSSSYFLKPGNAVLPFIYKVERIRDGFSYMTREVRVYQVDEEDLANFDFENEECVYTATLSFKKLQPNDYDYQVDPEPAFEAPDSEIIQWQLCPDVDCAPVMEYFEQSDIKPQWHPIDCRKMDTREFNKGKALSDRRILHYWRSTFELGSDPNLHVALMLYMSDRNSLFTIMNIQDNPYRMIKHIASLNHVFTLHMLEDEHIRTDGEFIQFETWSSRAYDSRGLYNGRFYTRSGKLVASFSQDGVVRTTPMEKL